MNPVSAPGRIRPRGTGGSARSAAGPCRRLEGRHNVRRPRACRRNRWVRTGRRREASERSSAYKNANCALRVRAFGNQPVEFAPQVCRGGVQDLTARVEDNVPSRSDLAQARAESFADTALGAVALHGSTECARNGETKARPRVDASGAQAKRGEIGAGEAHAALVNLAEVGRTQDAGGLGKAKFTRRTARPARR